MARAKILTRNMYRAIKSAMHREKLIKSKGAGIRLDLTPIVNSVLDKYFESMMITIRGASNSYQRSIAKEMGLPEEAAIEIAYKDSIETQKEFANDLGLTFDYTNEEAIEFLKKRAEEFMSEPALKYRNEISKVFSELAAIKNTQVSLGDLPAKDAKISTYALDREIRNSTKRFLRSWDLGVKTNLAVSSASATHQSMVEGFGEEGDVDVVYMTEEDHRVSDWCHHASFNHDGTYKIYKLSDFKPAGYNLSRKRADWELCIPPSHFNCYDKDTEVLTSEGWKKWPDVTGEEKFLSMCPETRVFEYVKSVNLVKYEYVGPIHRISDEKGDILLTTPGHSHVISDNDVIYLTPGLDIEKSPRGSLIELENGSEAEFSSYKKTSYSIDIQHYSDMVYCAQLEKNHTMVVRREGRVTVSGNCRSWLIYVPKGFVVQKGGLLVPKV